MRQWISYLCLSHLQQLQLYNRVEAYQCVIIEFDEKWSESVWNSNRKMETFERLKQHLDKEKRDVDERLDVFAFNRIETS